MNALIDIGFLSVVAHSRTFWASAVLPFVVATALTLALSFWIRRRGRNVQLMQKLIRDDNGAAAAVDLVLVTPIVIAVILPIIQLSLVSHASLVVHHAAYSAARSARVWYWDRDTAFIGGLGDVAGALANNFLVQSYLYSEQQRQEALCRVSVAAKYALVPIAPARHPNVSQNDAPLNVRCGKYGADIATVLRALGDTPSRSEVFERGPVTIHRARYAGGATMVRKARYSFDDVNTRVVVDPVKPDVNDLLGEDDPNVTDVVVGIGNTVDTLREVFTEGNAWRVRAEVEFRYWLHIPFAAALLGTRQSEGFYAKWLHAEVILL